MTPIYASIIVHYSLWKTQIAAILLNINPCNNHINPCSTFEILRILWITLNFCSHLQSTSRWSTSQCCCRTAAATVATTAMAAGHWRPRSGRACGEKRMAAALRVVVTPPGASFNSWDLWGEHGWGTAAGRWFSHISLALSQGHLKQHNLAMTSWLTKYWVNQVSQQRKLGQSSSSPTEHCQGWEASNRNNHAPWPHQASKPELFLFVNVMPCPHFKEVPVSRNSSSYIIGRLLLGLLFKYGACQIVVCCLVYPEEFGKLLVDSESHNRFQH